MSDLALRRTSRVIAGTCLLLVAGFAVVDVASRTPFGELVRDFGLYSYVLAVSFTVVAALILERHPHHRLGWVYLLLGLGMTGGLAHGYADTAPTGGPPPLAGLASWVGSWAWFPSIGLFLTFALLLFPDGRLPSPRWRPVGWAAAIGILAGTLGLAFGAAEAQPASPRPVQIAGTAAEIGMTVLLLAAVASVASLFVRLRRARGEERQQLKWVVYAGVVTVAVQAFVIVTTAGGEGVGSLAQVAVAPLIPIATAIAIVRYRLYEIDLVVNKTMVFGLLAAFITTVYVGVVVGIGTLVGGQMDEPSVGLSLFATAVVAAAFQPARQRARRIANRLVYGHRANPYEVMADFSSRMAEAVATDEVLPRMAEAACQGIGAAAVTITVMLPTGGVQRFTWPEEVSGGTPPDHVVPVDHQGERIGEIAVHMRPGDRLTADDLQLVEDLAAQAGLALHTVGLNAELRARGDEIAVQAAAIRASRQRIVAAQDAERRRMERDIHDGAQQQLVAMSVKVGLVGQLLDRDRERALALLDDLGADANGALEGLRDLARGIFPPLLLEQGLLAALDAHVRKHAVPVTVVADPVLTTERLDQEVEVAAYFCCLEAVQNATKHAPGAPITVRLTVEDGALSFEIHDEGPGFDPAVVAHGSGLQNMSDRVAALGGTLTVAAAPGAGVTVAGRIPQRVAAPRS